MKIALPLLFLFSVGLVSSWGQAADFYISPVGADTWSGKLSEPNSEKSDGPFATLERARNAVREFKAQRRDT